MRDQFRIKETVVTIISDKREYIKKAKEEIIEARSRLEDYIIRNPLFKITLEPYECEKNAPQIVKRMCEASKLAQVGPMASVAGAIAEYAVRAMVKSGATYAIVDNGGDIAFFTDREITVGIYAGSAISIALKFPPTEKIMGICTSSGTLGYSISFGYADAVSVISENVALADALATAICNDIKKDAGKKEIEEILHIYKKKNLARGIIVIKGKYIGMVGDLPKIIRTKINPNIITRG
ncbi:MAG: UPF0280 family protein [Thermoplasmata archaeon]|nr:MAG: UPF0280 family protein [Thermoplasmata archaeon]